MINNFLQKYEKQAPAVVLPDHGGHGDVGLIDSNQETQKAIADPTAFNPTNDIPIRLTISDKIYLEKSALPALIVKALHDRLTFDNPLYQKNLKYGRPLSGLSPYLSGLWEDGDVISLLRGFASELIVLFHEQRIAFELDDQTRAFFRHPFSFLGRLKIDQVELYEKIQNKRYGIIAAPAGFGKRIIALKLAAERELSTLIIVRTKQRFYQWKALAGELLGIKGADLGLLGDGQHRIGRKLTIAIDRSLYRQLAELIPLVGFLIVDRCHKANIKIFYQAVLRFQSTYMLGLADSKKRSDRLTDLMHAFLGPLRGEIILGDAGGGSKGPAPAVHISSTGFDYEYLDDYGALITALCVDRNRNDQICADVLHETAGNARLGLVLSERRRHLKTLQSILARSAKTAEIITGKTSHGKKLDIVARARQKQISIVLMTQKSLSSVDLTPVKALFIASPFKSQDHLIAAINKLNVAVHAKRPATIYEYRDQPGVLKASFNKRIKLYRSMGASIHAL